MLNIPRALGVVARRLLAPPCGGLRHGRGAGSAQPGQLKIVTAFYPFQFVAERVAGRHAHVSQPDPAGRRAARPRADPAPGRARSATPTWSSTRGLPAGGRRGGRSERQRRRAGHRPAWCRCRPGRGARRRPCRRLPAPTSTPTRARARRARPPRLARSRPTWPRSPTPVAQLLGDSIPDHAADYRANAPALQTELTELDRSSAAGLTDLRPAASSSPRHAAFGYLARRYGLDPDRHQRPVPGRRAVTGPDRRGPGGGQGARGHHDLLRDPGLPRRGEVDRRRPRAADRRARPDRGRSPPSPAAATTLPSCGPTWRRCGRPTDVAEPSVQPRRPDRCCGRDLSVELGGLPVLRRHHLARARRRGGGPARRQRLGQVDPGPRRARPGADPARLRRAVRSAAAPLPSLVAGRLRPAALDRQPERGEGQGGGRLRPAGPAPPVRAAAAAGPGRGRRRPGAVGMADRAGTACRCCPAASSSGC